MTNTKGFLNRNQLKYLVIAAMLIDHIAWAFVPTASLLGQVMHIIGRLTGPTMAYMLAEGYRYTRSVKKYAMRLGIFAVISWLPFSYFESGGIRPAFGVIYAVPQPAGDLVLGQGEMLCFRKMAGSAGALYPVCVWRLGDVRCAVCTDLFPVSGESQGKMADVQRHYTGVLCQHAGK